MREHKIIDIRHLTDSTFVIRLERNGINFQTGQFIMLGMEKQIEQREYSVYSGEKDDFLEVLVREVEMGKISKQLKHLKPGDAIRVDGPFGFFKFHPDMFSSDKFLFIATGTGISPFHSFIRTHSHLNYRLVHGVRYVHEAYEYHDFERSKITLCTTGDTDGDFEGRVTDYLFTQEVDADANYFLCGNNEMIQEVFDILTAKGVPISNIYSEVYF